MNEELNLDVKANIKNYLLSMSFKRYKSPFYNHMKGYPVDNYYMIVVKHKHSSVFSLSNADVLYLNNKNIYNIPIRLDIFGIRRQVISKSIQYITDSDGDVLDVNNEYVIFLYVVFSDGYKRSINNFDNYLSSSEYIIM